MSRCDKLEALARRNLAGVRFEEACRLAECHGFVFVRQTGSHRHYRHPSYPAAVLNIQPSPDGNAKAYQVRQLLAFINERG